MEENGEHELRCNNSTQLSQACEPSEPHQDDYVEILATNQEEGLIHSGFTFSGSLSGSYLLGHSDWNPVLLPEDFFFSTTVPDINRGLGPAPILEYGGNKLVYSLITDFEHDNTWASDIVNLSDLHVANVNSLSSEGPSRRDTNTFDLTGNAYLPSATDPFIYNQDGEMMESCPMEKQLSAEAPVDREVESAPKLPLINAQSVTRLERTNNFYTCAECKEEFATTSDLENHCVSVKHKGLQCPELRCDFKSEWRGTLKNHISCHVKPCNECGASYGERAELERHAFSTGHKSIQCPGNNCDALFSRYDVYTRHMTKHKTMDVQRFPCHLCKRHRGSDAFKRKDHLTQHLRNYHHIGVDDISGKEQSYSCHHKDCPDYRMLQYRWEKGHAFDKRSKLTEHLKKVHDESPFPCTVPSCDRVGGKGYFRRIDLMKHREKVHADQTEAAN